MFGLVNQHAEVTMNSKVYQTILRCQFHLMSVMYTHMTPVPCEIKVQAAL